MAFPTEKKWKNKQKVGTAFPDILLSRVQMYLSILIVNEIYVNWIRSQILSTI
jgi:hypothetical protein